MSEQDAARVIAETFFARHRAEAARALERRPLPEICAVWGETSAEIAAPVVVAMDPLVAASALAQVAVPIAAGIVGAMPVPDAAVLLRRVTAERRAAVLAQIAPRVAARLGDVLRYPSDTAGALCDPMVFTALPDVTVADTIGRMRAAADRVIFYVFVIDRGGRLVGVLDVRDLLMAEPDQVVGAIASANVARMPARAGRMAMLAHPSWGDLRALPVIDERGRFLGVLRYQTVRRLEGRSADLTMETAALGAALAVGELCWTVSSKLVGELTGAGAALGTARRGTPLEGRG